MKQLLKAAFIPKTIDNSPVNWGRFAGKTIVQSAATTVGMYGGILLVAAAYGLWESKINELKEENEQLAHHIKILETEN